MNNGMNNAVHMEDVLAIMNQIDKSDKLLNHLRNNGLFEFDANIQNAFLCTLIDEIASNNHISSVDLLQELIPVIHEVNQELGPMRL